MAIGDIDRVNAPTLIRATNIASYSPAQPTVCNKRGQVHHACDEALRVATPRLKPRNGATSIGADGAIIATQKEGAGRNVLKRISTVTADLQHAAVETHIGIRVGRFKIEVVPECQARVEHLKKTEVWRVQPFVAHYRWIIDECCVRRCIGRRHWHSRIRCDPERRWSLRICCCPVRRQHRGSHSIKIFG